MSIFDEERKKMGLNTSNQAFNVPMQSQDNSIFSNERNRIMGEVKTYEYDPIAEDQVKQSALGNMGIQQMGQTPMLGLKTSPVMQQTDQFTQSHPPLPGRDIPVIGPILKGLDFVADNPISNAVAEYTMPNVPFIGQPGTNVRQSFLNEAGRAPATGVSKFIGAAAAPFFVPGAQLGTGNQIANATGMALEQTPKLANLGNISRSAIQGAASGGLTAFGSEYAQGNAELKDAAISGALGTALGGALGAGIPAAVEGVSKGFNALRNGISDVSKTADNTLPRYDNASLTNGMSKSSPQITESVQPTADTMKGNWFTNLFGDQGVGITPFGSNKRISKGPLTTSDQIVGNAIKNDLKGIKDATEAQARAAYQNFVDQLSPLKKISNKTYETAMDASRANNIVNVIVNDKFVTPEGNVIGQSMKEIFQKVARGKDNDFVDYLTLRHAKTRMERGERVYAENLNMTPDKVQSRIDMYNQRHPEFANIAKEWDSFNDNVLKTYGLDEGMISEDLYKAMREKNPNYSPMMRQFTRSEKPGRSFIAKTTNSSFSGKKAPINKVSPTGSVRNIVDPRKSTIERIGAFVNASMRNRVMQSMADEIARNPETYKGIAEIVRKPKDKTDLRKLLLDGGEEDFVEELNNDFKDLFKTSRVDGENIVRAMVNGQPVYIKVHDPEIVKTLIGMGPQASNVLIDVMTALSNATKRGATGVFAPVFAVKGATMDLMQSAIQAKNPVKQVTDTIYAIFSSVGDKLNIPGLKNLAEEYRRAGGGYSLALKGDRKLKTTISGMTRDPLLSPKGISKGIKNTLKAPFKALEAIGDIAENAPRMAAYKGELRRLGGERTPENIRQAMSQAREITTNFSRKGAFTRDIEAFVPYNNAAVQGVYRVARTFKENPVKTTAAIGALAVLPKIYEYMQFHDDPDYQNLPARERYRFLIVNKNQDGSFTKIPMEPAYNSIGEMTIEALRKYYDKDPNAFKGSADAIANAWTPPAVTGALQGATQGGGLGKSIAGAINSTVAAPFVATVSNQSFTGAPIVSKAVADRSPEYQYDERTSSVAKKISQVTGMSPMQVDYFIRSYGGDPARLLLPLFSEVGAGNTRNTLLKNFIVDPAYSNTLANDFYTAKEKLNQAYRDNQEMKVPLPSWYDDGLRKSLNSTAAGSLSKQLSILSEQKKKITSNTNLSDEQRTAQLRDAQAKINKIYMDINSKLQSKGVPLQ